MAIFIAKIQAVCMQNFIFLAFKLKEEFEVADGQTDSTQKNLPFDFSNSPLASLAEDKTKTSLCLINHCISLGIGEL